MIKSILLVVVLAILAILWQRKKSQSAKENANQTSKPWRPSKNSMWLILAITLAIVSFMLMRVGAPHWLGGLAASLLALLKGLGASAWRWLPLYQQWKKHNADQTKRQNNGQAHDSSRQGQNNQKHAQNMSYQEALDILDLSGQPNKDEIVKAHRRLMQKCHPDRGGNDYLAAKINLAKERLLHG